MTIFKSINPFNQELINEFPVLEDAQIDVALVVAEIAFMHWKQTSVQHRSDLLLKLAEVLRTNKEKYALHISLEMGKILAESRAEIEKCAMACVYYAENGPGFLADKLIQTDAKKSLVSYNPIGAVFAVMPWNFPFWQVIRFAAPTVLIGNVVLLKHAKNVSQCALDIEEAFLMAGFPVGVFQSLIMESSKSVRIIAHQIVQGVTLTGSEQAGSAIATLAGKHIKKSVLELGGSDPFIVLADADMHQAAVMATKSRMQNAGQSCIAAKRFIVENSVLHDFVTAFKMEVAKITQGNQLLDSTTMGPVSSLGAATDLKQQQDTSIQKGAQVIMGGKHQAANYEPTILAAVTHEMPAYSEELFGPIASIITANDVERAISIANNHKYGLGATLCTKDLDKAYHYAQQINSGSVFINAVVQSNPNLPFGGVKKSGYGRELADYGVKEFSNVKTIFIQE